MFGNGKQSTDSSEGSGESSNDIVSDEDLDKLAEIEAERLIKKYEEKFKSHVDAQIRKNKQERNHQKREK